MTATLAAFDAWVKQRFPFPDEYSTLSGLLPSWYVSPSQHLAQWILFNAVFIGVILYCHRKDPVRTRVYMPAVTSPPLGVRLLMLFCLSSLLVIFAFIVHMKYTKDSPVYLLQPCYIVHFAVLCAMATSPNSGIHRFLADFLSCVGVWSVGIALAFADLRTYTEEFDIFLFWAQHYSVFAAPLLMSLLGWIPIRTFSVWTCLEQWAIIALIHWNVLLPVGIVSHQNLNYLLAPPSGALTLVGKGYHWVQALLCLVITFATRTVIVEPFVRTAIWFRKHPKMPSF